MKKAFLYLWIIIIFSAGFLLGDKAGYYALSYESVKDFDK
jgi:hypothetical protein